MALCTRCGGGFDFYPLLKRVPIPPVEADPFCLVCGRRRHVTCQTCAGYGFVEGEGYLLRGYCTNCGEPMRVRARDLCPSCHGRGRSDHNCARRAFPEGAYRQISGRPSIALVESSRSRALLRRRR
jgi:hypothetical protein